MDQGELTRSYDSSIGGALKGDVFPIFIREPVKNDVKSLEAGRPIFDVIEMIRIIIPGDNKSEVVRLVKEEDKSRFAPQYEAFKREEEQVLDGTPVDAWPRLTTKEAMQLKAMNFLTVESIANCSDAHLHKLGMGSMMLRDLARVYIKAAKDGGKAEALHIENVQLRTQMDGMAKTIQELGHKLESVMRTNKMDTSQVNIDSAYSHARDVSNDKGSLPEGWEDKKTKELIDLCAAYDFAVVPRNKDEAVRLLTEYQATRDALRPRS